MSELSAPAVPAWIYKRDGRLVPFEADKIAQALFAASEALGQPDAFLARELTDSVLHFLVAETGGTPPTTAQVKELAAKVVRELGHPALTRAYLEGGKPRAGRREQQGAAAPASLPSPDSPAARVRACLRQFSLEAVFSRNLAAVQADGLLTLTGLDGPQELAACVLGPAGPDSAPALAASGLVEALAEARALAGSFVVLDGPEHVLAGQPAGGDPGPYVERLERGLRLTGLRVLVHLHATPPPAWAVEGVEGPLFAGRGSASDAGRLEALAEALRDSLLAARGLRGRMQVEWHLGEKDFSRPRAPGLLQAARAALNAADMGFRFDRPGRPVFLGPGLDRSHPAVLMTVGLHLPRLAGLAGVGTDAELFLRKLASLARLALSAGTQKRAYLRQQGRAAGMPPAVVRGFLLDRARLVVVPVGLDAAVRQLSGHGLCDSRPGLDLGRRLVQQLRAVLAEDGRAAGLDACLDGTAGLLAEGEPEMPQAQAEPTALAVAGLTAWDPSAPPRSQLHAASALHTAAGAGMAALLLADEQRSSAEELADMLYLAWRQTEVCGLRLVRAGARQQLSLPGLVS